MEAYKGLRVTNSQLVITFI